MKKLLILLLALLASLSYLKAQDIRGDFKKLESAYGKYDAYEVQISVFHYEKADKKVLADKSTYLFAKTKNSFWYKDMFSEVVHTPLWSVRIQYDHQYMVLQHYKEPVQTEMPILNIDIDTLLSHSKVTYKGIESKNKIYELTLHDDDEISKVYVHFDATDLTLRKIVYWYADGSLTENIYTAPRSPLTKDYFNLSNYVVRSGKGYSVASDYLGYYLALQ